MKPDRTGTRNLKVLVPPESPQSARYFIAADTRDVNARDKNNGKNVRDWIYVDDHCRAIQLAYENGRSGEAYNIGARNEQYNIDVVHAILDALGKTHDLIRYVADRLGHDRRYAIDPTKAETELGWKPMTSWEVGLNGTIDWYRNNQRWVDHVRSGEYREYYRRMYGSV